VAKKPTRCKSQSIYTSDASWLNQLPFGYWRMLRPEFGLIPPFAKGAKDGAPRVMGLF
jgi:hypothetical protein